MPLEKTINTSDGEIGIWRLQESSEVLIKQCTLSNLEIKSFNKLTAERRRKEFLASRILLRKILGKRYKISYNSFGKPLLNSRKKNISISHSKDFVCVFISKKKIGIDIEQSSRDISKVAKRFLHPEEQQFISSVADKQMATILLWSAKEAVFKCTNSQGIIFNKEIIIEPFRLKEKGESTARLEHSGEKTNYKVHYLIFENNIMVYCVEEQKQ